MSALVASENEAADELLLEALCLGNEPECLAALNGLIARSNVRGLRGVVQNYAALAPTLQLLVLENIKSFHAALRECSRSDDIAVRIAALKLVALGRQGKLAYIISENLHDGDESLSKTAVEAMVALARWVATETHKLQRQAIPARAEPAPLDAALVKTYELLLENRTDIEAAVVRAMDVHRGKHGQELLRAALLLCDSPLSKTLAILNTSKHAGQSPMVRRLQQPPASEHVEAFLLGASHGGLRTHFGIVFSHIEEAPVLDALLRKSHWLKDHQLQLCMHQVSRGVWWEESGLLHDIERRPSEDAVKAADWIAASGMHDVMQDERMSRLRDHAAADFPSRLHLLRLAMNRRRGASVDLIKRYLDDPDERLMRMAAREIVRRRPVDFENVLIKQMTTAPSSVRRIISRAIGQEGFESFWNRFERMDRATRRQAGAAMLKLLPDAAQRLARRLTSGSVEQCVRAMQIIHELGLSESLRANIMPLCSHPNARVRSKAISVAGQLAATESNLLLDKVLNDTDPRVRANAIEVLERKRATQYVPMLAQRARSSHNRERANAIKAMHAMRVGTASTQLVAMLRDERSEHRISALWTLRQIGWWNLLNEVGRIAKEDTNLRVRRYALGVLRNAAELFNTARSRAG